MLVVNAFGLFSPSNEEGFSHSYYYFLLNFVVLNIISSFPTKMKNMVARCM